MVNFLETNTFWVVVFIALFTCICCLCIFVYCCQDRDSERIELNKPQQMKQMKKSLLNCNNDCICHHKQDMMEENKHNNDSNGLKSVEIQSKMVEKGVQTDGVCIADPICTRHG